MIISICRLKRRIGFIFSGSTYSFKRGFLLPEDNFKRYTLKRIQRKYKISTFIETGTYEGETLVYLRKFFDELISFEVSDYYYKKSLARVQKFAQIKLIHGDSSTKLPKFLNEYEKKPIFFWLDGHYSGGATGNSGNVPPILTELKSIQNTNIRDHVIVIDDISSFSGHDAEVSLLNILDALFSINPDFKILFDYDMCFALPDKHQGNEFFQALLSPFVIR